MKVEAPSFKSWQQTDIIMHPGDTRSVSGIQLEVGTASQTVEVVASSRRGCAGGLRARASPMLTQTEINDIPLVSRNLSEVLKILPGVITTPNGISGGSGFVGNFLSLGLTGQHDRRGIEHQRFGLPRRNGLHAGWSEHSGSRLQLLVNGAGGSGYDAGSSGADIELRCRRPARAGIGNAVGKSGTREYHGQAYLYARNDILNANDWVDNSNGTPRGSAY